MGGHSDYWKSMGFTSLQTIHSKCEKKESLTVEDIIEDIYFTNKSFFANTNLVKLPIVSIDGTCCTGKTTICNKFKSVKTNQYFNNVGMNTNPLGALGYFYTSSSILKDFAEANKKESVLISDRTPFNNYQWSMLWQMIALHKHCKTLNIEKKTDFNAYTIINNINGVSVYSDTLLNMWRAILSNISTVVLDDFMKTTKIIYIVDSNEQAVKERMRIRNTGSDFERSYWNTYISIQNFAYAYFAEKYPKQVCFIDLNAYNRLPLEDILEAVISVIKKKCSNIASNPDLLKFEECKLSISCINYNKRYREHERKRPYNMDRFYSKIKIDYKTSLDKHIYE